MSDSKSKREGDGFIPTVAEAVATAEAWNERAALLSTMAFELRTVFAPIDVGGPTPYLIKRIGGGASPVSTAVLEDVRAELFVAAQRARQEAHKILASTTTPAAAGGHAPGLSGSETAPTVDYASIEIPSGGDEIVANPDCPRARRKLGAGPIVIDGGEEEARAEQERSPRTVEVPPVGTREDGDRQSARIRVLRPKARTR